MLKLRGRQMLRFGSGDPEPAAREIEIRLAPPGKAAG
jgi:hypothetical protein